jgi:pimeloyl-ACP methyl ester carboxylesterase
VSDYLKNKMMQIDSLEYKKIWGAIYDFDMFPLERITCPTLVMNGEFESKKVKRHSQELLKRIPNSSLKVIPGAQHAINMEKSKVFNQIIDDFQRDLNS